jgi:predicted ester cyclase
MKKCILSLLAASFLVAACNNEKSAAPADNKETMSSASESKAEKNRQTALASVMAVNAHDADAVLKDITPDGVDYGDGSMPAVRGVDSVKAGLRAWLVAFPDVKGENLVALSNADGSIVTVLGDWTGTFKNDFMGMKATGKSYHLMDADVLTFNEEGKITSHRAIQSYMTMMSQVGASMPQ